ncbi:hypothetical protein Dimus_004220, partial [Dionaea muscipula]
ENLCTVVMGRGQLILGRGCLNLIRGFFFDLSCGTVCGSIWRFDPLGFIVLSSAGGG